MENMPQIEEDYKDAAECQQPPPSFLPLFLDYIQPLAFNYTYSPLE